MKLYNYFSQHNEVKSIVGYSDISKCEENVFNDLGGLAFIKADPSNITTVISGSTSGDKTFSSVMESKV